MSPLDAFSHPFLVSLSLLSLTRIHAISKEEKLSGMAAAPIDPGMYGDMSADPLAANAHQQEGNCQAFLQAREKGAADVAAFFAGDELATVARIEKIKER